MWIGIVFAVVCFVGGAVADEACAGIERLPQCAQSCLPDVAVAMPENCSAIHDSVCATDYSGITTCYENQCGLENYLYAMNITNTLCNIPPRNRKSTQIAVGSAFITITTVVVGLRLTGRPPFSASSGIDDAIGVITYCTAMAATSLMIRGATIGWGTDMWALSRPDIISQMKIFYLGIIFFYFTVAIAKLAILFFYLRIFTTPAFKRVTYAIVALCSAYAIAVVFQSAFDCTPVPYYWTRFDGVSQGTCLDYTAFRVMPPINVALDVVVMVLPLPLLLRLNLPLAKKIRVISMFSVGILIIIAGILRLTHLYHSITTYNITYNGGELSYFGIIEADVSVICTCLPAIAALLKRVYPRWFASSAETRYQTFQTEVSPHRGTYRSSTTGRKPVIGTEDDIHLFTVLSDDSQLQKPGSCRSPSFRYGGRGFE
ncbi:hypothetical protein BJX61DRAFT_544795 [Aspergillus egyptiacus]|nr:hypothetical protein BJX61DRAFT_544795 [Aspergillus egyptiacus]